MIFWSIWFAFLLIAIGIPEMVYGRTLLFSYFGNALLISIAFVFYGGMLIDMFVKINLPIRLPYGTDFLLKERVVIRNMRKGTNLAALVGLGFCLYWLKPRIFFEYFPSYLVVMSCFLAFSWSIAGLFLDARMVEDVRFRFYMDRLGITGLKRYRRMGTFTIGMLIITAIGFNILRAIPDLWEKFCEVTVVSFILNFIREYLSWLF